MTIREEDFDAMYGVGMTAQIRNIINDLAPVTRRDEWWTTDGPYEILAMHLMRSSETIPRQRDDQL